MTQTIRLETDPRGIATLTLARADKRNAMSGEMIAELAETASKIGTEEAIRAVILAADGPVFCAGGDLGWMREQMSADAETRRAEALKLARMLPKRSGVYPWLRMIRYCCAKVITLLAIQ